ncbi:MAG: SpoIIIAH-like family protein [Ruminococcaceae bacterium]|nr:SpoIIIAH-like family protein [Oscillospiraceae bacterium]
MMVIKKKQLVTVAFALLLVLAGYINFSYGGKEDTVTASNPGETKMYGEARYVSAPGNAGESYFNTAKTNKDKARSETLALIKELAESEDADKEAKKNAQIEMIKIAKNIEKESNIENILMHKGFENVSAFINDDRVTVSVLTEGLKPEEIARIRDVIISETGYTADKININEIK